MFASNSSAETGEPNEARKRSGSLNEHPSCSSLNERERNEVAPFVFVKIEGQSMVNDIKGTAEAEERPIPDEASGSTAISSGDQKTKDDREDIPSAVSNIFSIKIQDYRLNPILDPSGIIVLYYRKLTGSF